MEASVIKVYNEIGYDFNRGGSFAVKPYVMVGGAYYKGDLTIWNRTATESGPALVYGYGVRATVLDSFYIDVKAETNEAYYATFTETYLNVGFQF